MHIDETTSRFPIDEEESSVDMLTSTKHLSGDSLSILVSTSATTFSGNNSDEIKLNKVSMNDMNNLADGIKTSDVLENNCSHIISNAFLKHLARLNSPKVGLHFVNNTDQIQWKIAFIN